MQKNIFLISFILVLFVIPFSVNALTLTMPSVLNLYNATYAPTTINQTTIINGTTAGNCPAGQAVQNTTASGVQCINVSSTGGGSGTVTSVVAGFGLNATTITTSGTLNVNSSTVQLRVNGTCLPSQAIQKIYENGTVDCKDAGGGSGTVTQVNTDQSLIGGPITTTGTLGINTTNITLLTASVNGNWSADKASYASLVYVQTYVSGVNNLSQTFVQNLINANGNFSLFFSPIYINITGLQTSNTSLWSYVTNDYLNNTAVRNSIASLVLNLSSVGNATAQYPNITTAQNSINSLTANVSTLGNFSNEFPSLYTNISTKAGTGTGTCSAGYYAQNVTVTTSGVQNDCAPDTGGSGGVSDGNKGDITVSNSGATWNINNATITTDELNANTPYDILTGYPVMYTDFIAGNGITNGLGNGLYATAINTGTVDYPANNSMINAQTFGLTMIKSSTTTNSGYWIGTRNSGTSRTVNLTDGECADLIFYSGNLTNNTIYYGFHNSATVSPPTDGVYFQVYPNVSTNAGGVWIKGVSMKSNRADTNTSSNYTLIINTWYKIQLCTVGTNLNGITTANFSIYNQTRGLLWSDNISYNFPTTLHNWGLSATKAGTNASEIITADWMSWYMTRKLLR